MFGNFIFSFDDINKQTENINKKLSENNNSPPLEELLLEDGLVDELQSRNQKLIDYFNKERIKQMLDYIIKEPKEDDHNKGHKFPFLCSRLLNVEEGNIMNYFLKTNKELKEERNKKEENEKKLNESLNMDKFEENNEDNNDKVNNDLNDNREKKENEGDDIYFGLYKDEVNEKDNNKNEEEKDLYYDLYKDGNGDEGDNKNEEDEVYEDVKDNEDLVEDKEKENIKNDNNDNDTNIHKNDNLEKVNNDDDIVNIKENDIINSNNNSNSNNSNNDSKENKDEKSNEEKKEDNKDNNKENNDGKSNEENGEKTEDNKESIIEEKKEGNKESNNEILNEDKKENNKENNSDILNEDKKEDNKENKDKKPNEEKKEDKNLCLLNSSNINTTTNTTNLRYNESSKNKKENGKDEKGEEIDDNYPENRIEILDYLLSFLSEDSELNYVLCGYFSSLMTALLNINSVKIIKYLFLERKDILIKFAYHSYRKSIAETLCKIIKYENKLRDDNETYDEKQFSLIRLEIIKEIFDKIDINMDSEKLFSISFIINELTEDKKILESIISNKNIIHSFINKQLKDIDLININDEMKLSDIKNNFIIISDIIINWLNNIKNNDIQIPMILYEVNDFDDEDNNPNEDIVQQKEVDNTPPEVHHTILSQALFDVLPNLIQKNFNKRNIEENKDNKENNYIIQSYNDFKLVPLGLHRIKIVEILTNLIPYFKNIPNDYDNLLINSDFFQNSINYIFEYEWNNLYQEVIYQFFKQLFKYNKDYPYHEISSEYLFSKLGLLNIIITNFAKNKNESNNDNNSKHGYVPLLVSLSYKINSLIGGNYININKNKAREGSLSFINEGRDLFGNSALDIFFNMSLTNNNNNNENKKEEVEPVNCLKKYCTEEWNKFFSDNIVNLITLYEEKLCQQKVSVNVSFGENDDLFAKDDNNNENEALLGVNNDKENNNEDNNNDDLVNTNDDVHKKNEEMAKFKDMEINLNDFNFTNDREYKTNEQNKQDNIDLKEEKSEEIKKEEDKKEVIEENKSKEIQLGEEKKEGEEDKIEMKKEEIKEKVEVKNEEVKKEEDKKEEVKEEEIKKIEVKIEEIIKKEEVKKEEENKENQKIEEQKEEVEKIEEKKEEKIKECNIENNKEDKIEKYNKEVNNKENEDDIKNDNKNNEIFNEKEKKAEINEEDKKENEDKGEIKKEIENKNTNDNK